MSRTPTFQAAMRRHVLHLFFVLCFPFFAKADVGISFQMNQNGDQVTADVLVNNFTEILTMQFTIHWDTNELEYVSVGNFNLPDLNINDFGYVPNPAGGNGVLTFSWAELSLFEGVTLPDCSSIFSITFHSINGQVPGLSFVNSPTPTEITNADSEFLNLIQNPSCTSLGKIEGKIISDESQNCTYDEGEFGIENGVVKIKFENEIIHMVTMPDGSFSFTCQTPGIYEVSAELEDDILNEIHWTFCQPMVNVEVSDNQTVTVNFVAQSSLNPSSTVAMEQAGFSASLLQNPISTGQEMHINVSTEKARSLAFEILDTSGKLLHQSQQYVQVGTSSFSIQTPLLQGLYLLRVSDEHGTLETMRLMVF